MKKKIKRYGLFLILVLSMNNSFQARENDFPKLTGPYLGQKPPGTKAELFAPAIVSTIYNEDGAPIFTPDGNEIFWRIAGSPFSTIAYMKQENGVWSEPEIAPFAGNYQDAGLVITPDGKKIFFESLRPITGVEGLAHFNTWMIEKINGKWSDPVVVGPPVDNPNEHYTVISISSDGTLIKQSGLPGGKGKFDLYISKHADGKWSEPVSLPGEVNTEFNEAAPTISPDGSYIIFNSGERPDSLGSYDLYVTFKKKDGTWSKPVNLGEGVNSEFTEKWPCITTDGKYLFFISDRPPVIKYSQYSLQRKTLAQMKSLYEFYHRPKNELGWGDVYWVDTKIIEELKPKE